MFEIPNHGRSPDTHFLKLAQPTAVKLDYIESLLAEFDYIYSMKWQEFKMMEHFRLLPSKVDKSDMIFKIGLKASCGHKTILGIRLGPRLTKTL